MILCNRELHTALDQKRLIIVPEPKPREPEVAGGHCPFDTHSVDLTLSAEIILPLGDRPITIDLTQAGGIARLIDDNCKRHTLSMEQPYRLLKGQFILGKTSESVGLPIIPGSETCLAARIEGKSSRARAGLLIHFTAPTVHPGWNGPLVLEMINLGPWPIILTAGMAIAQLIVEEVRGCPRENPSQFQNQSSASGVVGNGSPVKA